MSASLIFCAMSMFAAVLPVTSKVASVPDSMPGRSSRMVPTSFLVCSLVGAVEGVAERIAVSPAGLNRAGETETTPSVAAILSETPRTALFGSGAWEASTTSVSGPLKPGPNASARSS